jgi:hypothetical protein
MKGYRKIGEEYVPQIFFSALDKEGEFIEHKSPNKEPKQEERKGEPVQLSLHDNELFHLERQPKEASRINIKCTIPAVIVEKVDNITREELKKSEDVRNKELQVHKVIYDFLAALHDFLNVQDDAASTPSQKREATGVICHKQEKFRNNMNEMLVSGDPVFVDLANSSLFLGEAVLEQETFDKGMDILRKIKSTFKEEYTYSKN